MDKRELASSAKQWDVEYRGGKYEGAEPVAFVGYILATLQASGLSEAKGLYVGCGNGRNYIPLLDAGLKLDGIDISRQAIQQIKESRPEAEERLKVKDFESYESAEPLDYLVSLQIFQHGDYRTVEDHFAKTASLLRPGGLFFLRVNSTDTDIYFDHQILEETDKGGLTVCYEDGPKKGRKIHFFTEAEISDLMQESFDTIMPLRQDRIQRESPKTGSWVQWEGAWRKKL